MMLVISLIGQPRKILRALCRVNFPKRSLLNAITRRLRDDAESLQPRKVAQVLSDLRRLGHLDGPLLLTLLGRKRLEERLDTFSTFDLPLLLVAFARSSLRDEARVRAVGDALRLRSCTELTASVVATSFYALALLDCGTDGTASNLVSSVLPRCLMSASQHELVNIAFGIVILDLPAGELLSFVLERIARQVVSLTEENRCH